MEFAVLFVPCHFSIGIAAERDLFAAGGGEHIDSQGAERIFRIILDGEEFVTATISSVWPGASV